MNQTGTIQPGNPRFLGSQADDEGVNFALYSSAAKSVELCLFDESGNQAQCYHLPENDHGIWHGFLPGCKSGQRYGYRVHGTWAPEKGLRFNPSKLLIDPYARALEGEFRWSGAVFDFDLSTQHGKGPLQPNRTDSAPFVPKCVVTGELPEFKAPQPRVPWTETVIYEANVRGYTMCHPEIPQQQRGKFSGMSNGRILQHLKALGITTLELMPVHAFIDEAFLEGRGRKNFWGYNSINFFTPEARYSDQNAINEFREMVDAIHDAGIEVILDVVYNHTAEGGDQGPSLSFRGIDNLSYYRTEPDDPTRYINDTGCGNTLNADHSRVQALVLDSLIYWRREMGVDGFRFDLAPVLGRTAQGFDPRHPLLRQINEHPVLGDAKLIAEPWDPGPGGYQLGQFPSRWAEWNDRYRDSVRHFWRGDTDQLSSLAKHLHGSSDVFEPNARAPQASINFITSHDGFTLNDLVSYENRHNEANGENNRDGHAHNFSCNHGVEGDTENEAINHLRRRQRLNMLATLLLSKGTPMLLAGDEFGNAQAGNNNAYAQDNETGWLDWSGLQDDPDFFDMVRRLLQLRRQLPHLASEVYLHGRSKNKSGRRNIEWLSCSGKRMKLRHWHNDHAMTLMLPNLDAIGNDIVDGEVPDAVALMFNASGEEQVFNLPGLLQKDGWEKIDRQQGDWSMAFSSSEPGSSEHSTQNKERQTWTLPSKTIACVIYSRVAHSQERQAQQDQRS